MIPSEDRQPPEFGEAKLGMVFWVQGDACDAVAAVRVVVDQ